MSRCDSTAHDLDETCAAELRHPGPHIRRTSGGSAQVLTLTPRPVLQRPELSDRERQVLLAWFSADSKTEAAGSLFIAIGTMNTHITRIRTKYSAVGRPASTKASLFARALQDDITQLDDW